MIMMKKEKKKKNHNNTIVNLVYSFTFNFEYLIRYENTGT